MLTIVVAVGNATAQSPKTSDLDLLSEASGVDAGLSIFDTRRLDAAERILAIDSTNPQALTELGRHYASGYRWYANLIRVKQPIGGGLRSTRDKEFARAMHYLEMALSSDSAYFPAAREIVRLLIEEGRLDEAERFTRSVKQDVPGYADAWLLHGLIAQLRGRSNRTIRYFDKATTLMSGAEAERFTSTANFLNDKRDLQARSQSPQSFDQKFWSTRDPLYLTEENERLADHYARMVYADLWYGTSEQPGWETERGDLIVRYGIPMTDMTFTGVLSRFNVLDFGDFDFVFEDQTRGGHYTLYSPKAGAGSSWAFDYVIQAGEMEKSLPERYRLGRIPEVSLQLQVAEFRGETGRSDFYLQYAIPLEDPGRAGLDFDPRSRIGGFVTNADGLAVRSSETAATGAFLEHGDRTFEVGAFEFVLEPGHYRTSLEFLNQDRSAFGVRRDSIFIRNWPETGLTLSDILVASEIEMLSARKPESSIPGGRIVRGGMSLLPDPWARVENDQEVLIYFEIYGLQIQSGSTLASYRLVATLEERIDRGPVGEVWSFLSGSGTPSTVSISSVTEVPSSKDARFLALDVSTQPAGSYTLTVGVEDLSSSEVTSLSREIEIVDADE